MTKEIWRSVPKYEQYQVSTLGRVRSWKPIRGNAMKPVNPRIYNCKLNSDGYPCLVLYGATRADKLYVTVPRLVLTVWRPGKEYLNALHKNGVKTDNRLSNLYWGTCKQNSEDSKRHGTWVHGTRVNTCKLTPEQVIQIRNQKRRGNGKLLARKYGCTIWNVYAIWKGVTWKHVKSS